MLSALYAIKCYAVGRTLYDVQGGLDESKQRSGT